jgi:hypothetical protein
MDKPLENKSICSAIKKSDGKRCSNPSKFGIYCGVHKTRGQPLLSQKADNSNAKQTNTIQTLTRIAFISPIVQYTIVCCRELSRLAEVHSSWYDCVHNFLQKRWTELITESDMIKMATYNCIRLLRFSYPRNDLFYFTTIHEAIGSRREEIVLELIKEKFAKSYVLFQELRNKGRPLDTRNPDYQTDREIFDKYYSLKYQFTNMLTILNQHGTITAIKALDEIGLDFSSANLYCLKQVDCEEVVAYHKTKGWFPTHNDLALSYENKQLHGLKVVFKLYPDIITRLGNISQREFLYEAILRIDDIEFHKKAIPFLIEAGFTISDNFISVVRRNYPSLLTERVFAISS